MPDALLGALAGSRQFACAFDADGPLRKACLTSRLMGADAPDLVAQRVSAGSEAFAALQRAFSSRMKEYVHWRSRGCWGYVGMSCASTPRQKGEL